MCPINSGYTNRFPHPRDEATFRRIPDYPYAVRRRRKKKGERVVELVIDHGVPDIREFIIHVVEMRGNNVIRILESSHANGKSRAAQARRPSAHADRLRGG